MTSNLSSCCVLVDLNIFDHVEYFGEYHYYEKFDQNKKYTSKKFRKDFGYGKLNYKYILHILKDIKCIDKFEKYIVVEEKISETDLDELIPYCRCQYHVMFWMNPFRCTVCPCCVGCLDSMFPQQDVIDATRKYVKELH